MHQIRRCEPARSTLHGLQGRVVALKHVTRQIQTLHRNDSPIELEYFEVTRESGMKHQRKSRIVGFQNDGMQGRWLMVLALAIPEARLKTQRYPRKPAA